MTEAQLFNLQTAIVTCLTDPRAMADVQAGSPEWRDLSFLRPDLIAFLSSLHKGKRVDKLNKVFPLTMARLNAGLDDLIREFMARHRPLNSDSFTDACQFYLFLKRRWRTHPPEPPFLPDLAYCELARVAMERQLSPEIHAVLSEAIPVADALLIRRRRPARFHRCQYDIRALFDAGGAGSAELALCDTCIIVSRPIGVRTGRIHSIDEKLFELARNLTRWTRISLKGDVSAAVRTVAVLARLERMGALEVRLSE